MSIFKFNRSTIFTSSLLVFGAASTANALEFDTWSNFGDVNVNSTDSVSISTNSLNNDDGSLPDSNFNFSGNPAIDTPTLETNLGLPAQSLDPDAGNLIQATEGSGLSQQFTFIEPTVVRFDWQFLTNDETFFYGNNNTFPAADYGFFAVDGAVTTIASTESVLSPSSTNYENEALSSFSRQFAPGTYDIALGVVDVDNFDQSSALIISNANATAVPFELSPNLGLFILAITVITINLRRRLKKKITFQISLKRSFR